jgi:hypothetical protein
MVAFCCFFSALLASKHGQTKCFFTSAIAPVVSAKDWSAVKLCRCKICDLDLWAAAGDALQALVPLVEEEDPVIFHVAIKGHYGRCPGLQHVKAAATGATLSSAPELEDEVLTYFAAICNGRHCCPRCHC